MLSDQQQTTSLQSVTRNDQHQLTSTAHGVSLTQLGTTQAGLPRRRIRWTTQLNEDIVRIYYDVTRGETDTVNYRRQLHRHFVELHPELNHVSEQNIADRRRAIFNNNIVQEARRNEIRQRFIQAPNVTEIQQEENEQQSTFQLNEINEHVEYVTISEESDFELLLNQYYNETMAEYEGISPEMRPRLPRQQQSKRLNELTMTANDKILANIKESISSYSELDSVMYAMATAIIKLNG